MTYTVHKQPLTSQDVQTLSLPFGAEILCVKTQRDTPCVWYRFTRDAGVQRDWKFYICGTGHDAPYPQDADYIDTFMLFEGSLVFHVFARVQP